MSTNHADFKVKHGLVVNTTASFLSTVTSVSTTTGGVILSGGAGIAKDVVIGGSLNVGPVGNGVITSQGDISLTSNGGSVIVTTSTNATNTTTGALQVVGGVGIQGDLYARNLYSNGQQVGLQSNTTTNLAGGLQYQIPYQSGPGSTTFIIPPPTTQNSLLQFTTGTGFTWTNTTTVGGGTFFYSPIVDTFTSNGTTTTFALSVTPASKNLLTVVIDGVTQLQTAFSLSGNNLVFSEIPYNGAVIDVHYSQVLSTTTSPAAGFPGQIQYNWNGMISGTTFMSYNSATGVVSITATTAATSTQTGALTVTGGMGIGGDLYVGGDIVANRLTIQLTTVTTTLVTTDDIISTYNTTPTNSTNTGALQIGGGIGVAGGGYFGGVITATNVFVNGYAVSTASALTIQGSGVGLGTAGTLNFATGTIATVANSLATIWLNTATLMSNAVTAINLAGGAFGSIPVQSGSGTTSFIAAGTQGQMFVHGVGQGYWENTSSIYVANASVATNIRAGTAGQLVYQSAANTTGFINTATTGNFLQANYAGAPTWTSTSSMYVYRATVADSASGTAGSVANALSTGTGLLFNAGTTYDGSAARTISLNTTTLVATAVTAFTANKVANALSAGTGLTGTAFDGSAAVTWTLNTATLMQVATQVVQSHSTGTGILGSSYNGSTAQTWTLDTSTLMARAVQTVQSLTAGTGLTGTAFNGSTAQTWTLNTATLMQTAVNLAGGSAGQFAYQTAANTTAFMSTGSMYVYRATIADSASGSSAQVNTQAQIANATYFPTFVDSNNSGATGETVYTTSSFILNPSTGQVGLGYISTSSRLTVNGRIESMTDPASEGGQVVLRGKNWYRWSIDNYQDTFRIIREDDVTEANGQSALIISSGTNSAVMLGTTTPYSGERLAVNGGVYVNGIATATTFVGALTGTASNATTATAAATAYSTIGTLTAGTGLSGTAFNGSANQTWTLNTATLMANAVTAINLAGGSSGQFAYQTGASATSFVSASNMYVARAAYVDTVAQVTNATYYPAFVDSNNATAGWEPVYTTSSFSVNAATGVVSGNMFAATNNGNGTNFKVGDDAWIGDVNTADTFRVTGQQNAANGYIIFGNNDTIALGRAGSGSLTYGGNVIVHGGNTSTTYVGRAVLADSVTGSAGSLVNAVTFNNAGSGDASGTTYNGGSARTISYNTLGAMPTTGGTFSGPVTFSGAVTFSGTATYVLSTQTFYTDNILNLHVPPSGVNGQWTQDDGKDVGFKFHYYTNSTDTNAALVLANDTKWLEWYSSGAEGTSTFAGSTYGNFKTGGIWATSGAGVGYTSSQIGEKFGVNGGGYFNGIVTATTFVGALTGTASNATNATTATSAGTAYSTIGTHTAGTGLSGTAFNGSANQTWTLNTATLMQTAVNLASGSAGQLHYQTAANTSGFINTATTGNFLQANYVGAPTWTSTGSMYVGRAVIADSVSGSAGSLVNALSTGSGLLFNAGTTYDGSAARTISLNTSTYMALAANATSANKVANAHSAGTGLTGTAFDGSAAQTWTLNTATLMQTSVSAINLSAGSAMALPYQSASGTTAYLSAGTSGYILQTNGTGSAPTWVAASGLSAGTATNADNLKTIQQTASANYYPSFVDSNNSTAAYEAHYTTSSFYINPASGAVNIGGTLTAPFLSASGGATMNQQLYMDLNGTTYAEAIALRGGSAGSGGVYIKFSTATQTTSYFGQDNGIVGTSVDLTAYSTAGVGFRVHTGGNATPRLVITANGGVAFGGATNYGSSGQILQSNGDAAPTWVNPSGLSVSSASQINTVQASASAGTIYPTFVDSNNASSTAEYVYTTSSFYINANTGYATIGGSVSVGDLAGVSYAPLSLISNTTGKNQRLDVTHYRETAGTDTTGTYLQVGRYGGVGGSPTLQGFMRLRDSSAVLHSVAKHPVAFGPDASTSDAVGIDYYGRLHVGINVGGSTPTRTLNITASTPTLGFIDGSGGISASAKHAYLSASGGNLAWYADVYNQTAGGITFAVDNSTTAVQINAASTAPGGTGNGSLVVTGGMGVSLGANFGGVVTATNFSGSLSGGAAMSLVYQSAANTTAYLSAGTSGYILQTNGTGSAPTWVAASTIAAGSAPLTNTYVGFGSASNLLTGSSALTFDGTVLSVLGGASNGYIKFATNTGTKLRFYDSSTDKYGIDIQSSELRIYSGAQGASTGGTTVGKYDGTTFTEYFRFTNSGGLAVGGASNYGSSGQVLQSNGNASPTWVNPSGLTVSASTTALRIVFNDGPRDLSDRLPNSYTRTVNWDFVGAGTAGTSGNYAGVMTFAPWTGTTASTGDGSYQLAFGNASGTNASGQPTLRIRTGIDSTWNSWYTLLHAGNVSSYTAGGISNFTAATSSNPMDASSPPTIDAIGYVSSNIPSSYGLGGSVGSQSDGGLYVAGYSTSWYHEIYGDFRTGGLAVRGKYSGTWQSWRNIPCISVQDTAPSIYNPGDLWWESDTGRLKVLYYDGSSSQWVDVVPVVDTSLFFSKAGGAISGPVSINGTLDVTGNITATAEITAYYSDRRLKTDIVTIENALVKVKKLNGVTYRPNELAKSYGLDTNSDVVGLFADEVEAVLPQAVKPAPFDVDENGNSKSGENYKTIQYEKVVPLLVEAIKDQQKIIEEQQAKIDRLMKHLGLE